MSDTPCAPALCPYCHMPMICPVCQGGKGGRIRARRMSAEERKASAIKAARARWQKKAQLEVDERSES